MSRFLACFRVAMTLSLFGCASADSPGGDAVDGEDVIDASQPLDIDGSGFIDAGGLLDARLFDAMPRKDFGEVCGDPSECESDICVFSGSTGVCSSLCPPECPDGYGCYAVLGGVEPGEISNICVPETDQLCTTCGASSECGTAAQNLCVADADGASWCARDCSIIGCPDGYSCESVTEGATTFEQCLPASGFCDCGAADSGTTKSCSIVTPFGMCAGSKACAGAGGWGQCQPPSPTDLPDGAYVDDNCDGIDGSYAAGIFVSVGGADGNTCGLTHLTACKTIGRGLQRSLIESRNHIYIQAGTYDEVVVLQNGKNLWGGFDASWQRGPRSEAAHAVRIRGGLDSASAQYLTVKAHDLVVPSVIADVILEGPDAAGALNGAGRSSYAVHARNAQGLGLERITIEAGNGAPGPDGSDGAPWVNLGATVGMEGSKGGDGSEFNSVCNNSSHGAAGSGGSNNACGGGRPTAGGKGGDGGEMDTDCGVFTSNFNATGGDSGANAAHVFNQNGTAGGGGGGAASNCKSVGGGGTGKAGRIDNGGAGSKGSGSQLLGNFWIARSGTAGGTGQNGGGGGGGGGAGGCDDGQDSVGGGGGGGGAGGCSAVSGGAGGGGGGGSFAVFAVASTVSASDCAVSRGVGGKGGEGGDGGTGQSGGPPGGGGTGGDDYAAAGPGGPGAHGGHGGGGGGGAGGASFGFYTTGSTITQTCSFSGGAPGAGGAGGSSAPQAPLAERDGNAGPAGDPGPAGTTGTCSAASGC